jgi:metal-responsive CopG/Arc/MetJ family transcriptional regulator
MTVQKIAITMEEDLLKQVDRLISTKKFPNRSRAFQEAVREQVARLHHGRLARESAKLDCDFEQKFADEGLRADEWPEY